MTHVVKATCIRTSQVMQVSQLCLLIVFFLVAYFSLSSLLFITECVTQENDRYLAIKKAQKCIDNIVLSARRMLFF